MAVVPRLVVVYHTARMTYVSDLEPFKPERLVSSSVRRFRDDEVDVFFQLAAPKLCWIGLNPLCRHTQTRRVFISTPSSSNSISRALGESTKPPQLLLRFAHTVVVTLQFHQDEIHNHRLPLSGQQRRGCRARVCPFLHNNNNSNNA
jgi:hypothetical protein